MLKNGVTFEGVLFRDRTNCVERRSMITIEYPTRERERKRESQCLSRRSSNAVDDDERRRKKEKCYISATQHCFSAMHNVNSLLSLSLCVCLLLTASSTQLFDDHRLFSLSTERRKMTAFSVRDGEVTIIFFLSLSPIDISSLVATVPPDSIRAKRISTAGVSSSMNESLFLLIAKLLNGTELYKHQVADLIEPEKYSINGIHAVIWTLTILTYLLATPIVLRMFVSRAYENVIDYFSCQIVLCAFIAWIPALILLLHHWLEIFTSSLCQFHYVILSTNETVG